MTLSNAFKDHVRSRVPTRTSLIVWLDHGKTQTRMHQDYNRPSDLVFPQLVQKRPCLSVWAQSSAFKTQLQVQRSAPLLSQLLLLLLKCILFTWRQESFRKVPKAACCSIPAQVLHLFHVLSYELEYLFLKRTLLQVGRDSWQCCTYSCIKGPSARNCYVFMLTGKGSCQLAPTMDGLMIAMFRFPFSCWIRYSDKALV